MRTPEQPLHVIERSKRDALMNRNSFQQPPRYHHQNVALLACQTYGRQCKLPMFTDGYYDETFSFQVVSYIYCSNFSKAGRLLFAIAKSDTLQNPVIRASHFFFVLSNFLVRSSLPWEPSSLIPASSFSFFLWASVRPGCPWGGWPAIFFRPRLLLSIVMSMY